MSQSPQIKGGATDEAFQEQCFLCDRRASIGANFNLLNSQDLVQKNIYKTLKERKENEKSMKGLQ